MQLTRSAAPATCPATRRALRCCASAVEPRGASRRALLAAAPLLLAAAPPRPARAAEPVVVTVDSDEPGFGRRSAQDGDLLLVHYKGTLSTGDVFDSTLGGEVVRTNASSVSIQPAAAVPRAISLRAGDVQPGVCAGLRTALLGMRVGGKRTVTVPPELGFGQVRANRLVGCAIFLPRRPPRAGAGSCAVCSGPARLDFAL